MNPTANVKQPVFVVAAIVAADLFAVRTIAKEIALGAKNAKVLAVRVGDRARGFQPLTAFIDDLARQTIDLAAKVDRESLAVSRAAVAEARADENRKRFVAVKITDDNRHRSAGVERAIQTLAATQERLHQQINNHFRELGTALEEIAKATRAAKVIATNSRVEASVAGEYRKNLETVADGLQQAAIAIEHKVAACRRRLADRMANQDVQPTEAP